MSNPESFIDEVSEEVRRDRLYALMRRWGWIPVLVVLVIVGGAIWTEWNKSQQDARAQGFGDAVISALDAPDISARRTALAEVTPASPEQEVILSLLTATTLSNGEDGDPEAARTRLLELAERDGVPVIYRDVALLKAILLGGTGDAARDGALLEELARPGAPFRPLAIEQQAMVAAAAGDPATAITLLRILTEEAGVSEGLQRRAVQLIIALGGTPEPA